MMAFSSIGVLVGLSAGVVFAISFENYNASVWGVMSGEQFLLFVFEHVFIIEILFKC